MLLDLFLVEENVFGGSVPKNYFPAVEKGLSEAMAEGVLLGYPMVNLAADLTGGSYHDVDSNELSFKLAARLAYKELVNASPTLLEPIGTLKVSVPESMVGDVMGDQESCAPAQKPAKKAAGRQPLWHVRYFLQ